VVEALRQKRIYFGRTSYPFGAADRVHLPARVPLAAYCCFRVGDVACEMGAFSYSESALPLDMKVGRYCSIAEGLQIYGERHPRL
jgi:hypothetical protein